MHHAFIGGAIFGLVIIVFVATIIFLREMIIVNERAVVIVGTALALAGLLIPWFWVTFSPPHGYAIVNGGILKAATYSDSGLAEWSDSGGKLLWTGVLVSIPIALSYLTPLYESARGLIKLLHAAAHLLVAFALMAFVWLQLAFWNSGFRADFVNQQGRTQSALAASQYVSGHLGAGLVLLTLGVIAVGAVIIKQLISLAGLLLVVIIVLAIFDRAELGSLFHTIWTENTFLPDT